MISLCYVKGEVIFMLSFGQATLIAVYIRSSLWSCLSIEPSMLLSRQESFVWIPALETNASLKTKVLWS